MANFQSRTGSRALTRLRMQQEAKQQLLGEASALQPDYDAATKALIEKDLYSADYAPLAGTVDTIMSDYLGKFNKDPFFAFSREGRQAAHKLKAILNDPTIKRWEDDAKLADEHYKKAQENDLGGDFVVNGDKVAVIRNGKREFVDIDRIGELKAENEEGLLTVDDDHYLTRNKFGVRNGVPTYNMASVKDIDAKIRAAFAGTGSTDNAGLTRNTGAGVDTSFRNKNNRGQLAIQANNLLTKELTQDEKNTLMSKYLQTASDPSKVGFKQWLTDRIYAVAEGKEDSVTERKEQVSLDLQARKAAKEGQLGKEPLSPAHGIITGFYSNRPIVREEKGTGTFTKGNLFPLQETFERSRGKYKDENGVEYTSRKMTDLRVFSDATDLGNTLLRVAGNGDKTQGEFIKVPNLPNYAVVADDPTAAPALVYEYAYLDNEGAPQIIPSGVVSEIQSKIKSGQPLPQSLQRYTSNMSFEEAQGAITSADYPDRQKEALLADAQKQAQTKGYVTILKREPYVATGVVFGQERDYFGEDMNASAVDSLLDVVQKAGYSHSTSGESTDYYNKYSGKGSVLDNSWLPGNQDRTYRLDVRIPLKSFQALHAAFDGTVKGEREDTNIGTMGFFPKFDVIPSNVLDPTSIPNQVGRQQFLTLDAFKNGGQ